MNGVASLEDSNLNGPSQNQEFPSDCLQFSIVASSSPTVAEILHPLGCIKPINGLADFKCMVATPNHFPLKFPRFPEVPV